MKKFSLWFLMIGFVLIIAACGGNEEKNTDKKENADSASLYEEIKDKGVITVGTEGTYAPFSFHNEAGELTGYDVEVMKEVAKRMGVKVEFKETQWDSMFAGLNAKRFDLIANQVGINEDRLANYEFSQAYTYSSSVIVVPKDNTDIKSFEDIKGKKSAQSLTSNYGKQAEENGAELVGVEGLAQAVELLKQGRADVTLNDKLAVLDYLKVQGGEEVKIAVESDDISEMAFVMNKGNKDLADALNEQLSAMREDGTLAKISQDWFGEDVSTK